MTEGEPAFNLGESTVAIVGLGLLGGSMAMALSAAGVVKRIIGVDRDQSKIKTALEQGVVEEASDDLGLVSDAEIIVLATPVRTILRLLPSFGQSARDGTLIVDVGSTKQDIVRQMDNLPARLFAVGGHPMCGKEKSGLSAAEPDLFRDRLFVLTPTERSSEAALSTAARLAEALGSKTIILDAKRHDRIAAATSHLPYLVASNLVQSLMDLARVEPEAWDLAATGFSDTTRLAASDIEMMLDILLTNSENVADRMRSYSRHFAELADAVYDEDETRLRAILSPTCDAVRSWRALHPR